MGEHSFSFHILLFIILALLVMILPIGFIFLVGLCMFPFIIIAAAYPNFEYRMGMFTSLLLIFIGIHGVVRFIMGVGLLW